MPFRSTIRSIGPTVIFMTVVPLVDRPGLDTESSSSLLVDWPIDRGHFPRAELSGRSTGLSVLAACTSYARR